MVVLKTDVIEALDKRGRLAFVIPAQVVAVAVEGEGSVLQTTDGKTWVTGLEFVEVLDRVLRRRNN